MEILICNYYLLTLDGLPTLFFHSLVREILIYSWLRKFKHHTVLALTFLFDVGVDRSTTLQFTKFIFERHSVNFLSTVQITHTKSTVSSPYTMSEVPQPPNADHLNAIQEAAKLKEKERAEKAEVKDKASSSGLLSEIEQAGLKNLENQEKKRKESYLQDIASGSQKLKQVSAEKAETKEKAGAFLEDIKKLGDQQ